LQPNQARCVERTLIIVPSVGLPLQTGQPFLLKGFERITHTLVTTMQFISNLACCLLLMASIFSNNQFQVCTSIERLRNIDPADWKFFSPGYRAQTISINGSKANLPTIENELGNQIPIWFLLK
jgi:hypothetical protein